MVNTPTDTQTTDRQTGTHTHIQTAFDQLY